MYQILFRHSFSELGEYEAACRHFNVVTQRSHIEYGATIIPRYSLLPYPKELENDVVHFGGSLINSTEQHEFIADMRNWYFMLYDRTPKTWFTLHDALHDPYEGPYVLKGKTNSRKSLWRTHMYAENKEQMRQVYMRLLDDSLIGSQDIYIRQFEKFVNYGESEITHAPITKEFRFFVYENGIIGSGFYWSNYPEIIEQYNPRWTDVPTQYLFDIISRVGNFADFWVMDIAQHEDGRWRVVELNDGCMSGLGTIDPDKFYAKLKERVYGQSNMR